MSALEPVTIPDLGDIDQVDVIEMPVQVGAQVKQDDVLLVLESDKASMEIVAPCDGTLAQLFVEKGQAVASGQKVAELSLSGESPSVGDGAASEPSSVESTVADSSGVDSSAVASAAPLSIADSGEADQAAGSKIECVPDLGDIESAEVIELSVSPGDSVQEGDPLLVLESDKASMEVPASQAGVVESFLVEVGARVSSGAEIAKLSVGAVPGDHTSKATQPAVQNQPTSSSQSSSAQPAAESDSGSGSQPQARQPVSQPIPSGISSAGFPVSNVSAQVHAGPAVRRLANELHVDLAQVPGTGPRGRVLKEDVHRFVNEKMKAIAASPVGTSGSSSLTDPLPEVDFSQWGEIEEASLSRIQKISAAHLHRSWNTLPHVTQFEEADITELEAFRQSKKEAMAKKGVKLTPLAFVMKACMLTLAEHPKFKSSLKPDGATLVYKHYCHIGFACETPGGLVVPVVRDVDKKSISELATEIVELSQKAREKRLKPADMKGAVFSISSLGGIGGTAFTPIINWPEVAILGVSKNMVKPLWDGQSFVPRTCVPLSLSYDHRVIDGADAARFTTTLKGFLEDLRAWTL